MSEHGDLLRALLVERYQPFKAADIPTATPQQLARAMAGERRLPKTPKPRRRSPGSGTIDKPRRTT